LKYEIGENEINRLSSNENEFNKEIFISGEGGNSLILGLKT
jgi:hypothetical protein